MRFPFGQSWQLRVIERGLRRSGPHLAVMLAIFARLNAGEAIVSREQARRPGDWGVLLLAVLAGLCARAGRGLGRIVRTVLTAPFAAKSAPHQIRSPRR